MATFLLVTTLITIAGLIATAISGLMASPAQAAQHIMFALMTVVIGLFSQSMTLFFFIGTGKQLKDKVKDTVHDREVRAATRALTMKVSPAATYAMFVLMITFITGGGVGSGKTPRWLHDVFTLASIAMYARAYWIQIQAMTASANLMERYLRD